jgi:Carboxypeptidase regulatory-like domain/TonB dependent receptor
MRNVRRSGIIRDGNQSGYWPARCARPSLPRGEFGGLRCAGSVALCVVIAIAGITANSAAQSTASLSLTGIVVDATDAVLPNAQVQLTAPGTESRSVSTDGGGRFSFDLATPCTCQVLVSLEGFRSQTLTVSVDAARSRKPLRVTLEIAEVHEEVTVNSAAPEVTNAASSNADAVSVDQNALEALPIFNNDAIAAMSRFLDSGSLGTSGATVLVDGVEVDNLDLSTSAIQQIKINQNPYSATYGQPGRGRIEVITKSATHRYQGEANLIFRDSHLNARNAFAVRRPPEQRRIVDGIFGGRLGQGGTTSLTGSATEDEEDRQAVVFATGLQGPIQDNVRQPYRHSVGSIAVTHQRGRSTASIRSSYLDEIDGGRGVGGTTLGSAGTTYAHRELDVTFNHQAIVRPALLNQFQIFIGKEVESITSTSPAPGLVVNGAFTGGGAQLDVQHPELHIHVSENVALTKRNHFFQVGVQVPDWTRRGIDDHSDFAGTYYFSDLSDYAKGHPYAFVQQRGDGRVVWREKLVSGYANDDWQIRPKATLSLGIRYDWSNYFADHDTIAPRLSLAITPRTSTSTVIRGGAGIFYDKVGPAPIFDVLELRSGGIQRTLLINPPYPVGGSALTTVPVDTAQFAAGIEVPWTLQYSVSIERQLTKAATLSTTYFGSHGTLLRSRDINAPLPPFYAVRPNPAFGVIRQIESAGRQRGNALQFTLRGRSGHWLSGQLQYTLSHTMNNSGGLNWFPANDYDLSGEWARADFDRRHRFLVLGNATPARQLTIGLALTLESGLPYTEVLGADIFNNGRGNARPFGVDRNRLQGGGTADVDVRISREFRIGGRASRTIAVALDAFNVLNRVNYARYVGTLTSPLFGQPVTAQRPRELQLSAKMKF